jgi:hypothetical protein
MLSVQQHHFTLIHAVSSTRLLLQAYDLVAGTTNLILSRYVSPTEAVARVPTLATNLDGRSLKGGVRACNTDGRQHCRN